MIKSVKMSTVSFWYVFYLLGALFWLLKNKQGTIILGSNKVISECSTHTYTTLNIKFINTQKLILIF